VNSAPDRSAGVADPLIALVDTSVWHRRHHPDVQLRWTEALLADRVATTPPVRIEVLYSARDAEDYVATADELDGLIQLPCTAAVFDRALEVQRTLAEQGPLHHRSVSRPNLLIAAVGELNKVTIWHYDEDYDRITDITGQSTEWIVPRGSL
jgi:predicted nucleic acid-binding protein